jgi:peptide/nickel transport system permease protein
VTVRRLIAARLAQTVVVALAVATITFVLLRLAPGDPFTALMESSRVTAEAREAWRRQWGYDRPLPEQWARYVTSAVRGELGFSHQHQRPVRDVLADAVPRTLLVMSLALVAAFALGMGAGILQARRRGSALDHGLGGVLLLFYSVPDFWLASLALVFFALRLRILPAGGLEDLWHDEMPLGARVLDHARHLVLPVGTLALLLAAGIARYQRAAVLDAAGRDFVRTARAKGADERLVLGRHVLRNALLPVITLLGLAFPALLGGAVFVEHIFGIPGMGSLAVEAIAARDYPVVLAVVLVGSVMVSLGSLVADVLAALADPRLRAA